MKIPFGKYIFLGMALIFLGSCLSSVEENRDTKGRLFFDTKDYFKKEIEFLKQGGKKVSKLLFINDKQDRVTGGVDFEKELDAFVKSNINKNALHDKYQVDSVYYSSRLLKEERYKALGADLRTRSLVVTYDSLGAISSIAIENHSENVLTASIQSLDYRPRKKYTITSKQKTITSEESVSKIEATFIQE